jgi:cytochrome c oxidase subunit III
MATLKMPAPSAARTGVWIGIATITMSFAAYTSALMVRQDATPDWRPFQLPPILYLNTVVLLLSSGTLAFGGRRILARWPMAGSEAVGKTGSAGSGVGWLLLTLGLGLLFLGGQVLAWRQLAAQGLFLATNPSSSFFYVFTVLHALHLAGGIVALGYVVRRVAVAVDEPPVEALGATSLYWHFMGVLWLYLLLLLALRL